MSLRLRFSLVILGLLLFALAIYSGAYYFLEQRSEYAQMNSRVQESARLAASVCREGVITGNWSPSQVHFRMLQQDAAVLYAECVDPKGAVLVEGGIRKEGSGKAWSVSHSIRIGERQKGVAKIGFNASVLSGRIRSHLFQTAWLIVQIASVTLLLGVVVAVLIARTLTRPVEALAAATKEISAGHLEYRLKDDGRADELGALRSRFNEMAERLEDLSRMKEQVVSSLTHDIKNPLASIKGCAEALLAEDAEPLTDKQRKYLKSSLECSLRLWSYIDNMLDVMKLQAGKYPVRISPTRICEIAKSVVADQKVKAKECRVTLKNDTPKDLPRVAADFELIHRVLVNLVSNALKFTSPKGRIEVSARVDGRFVRVEVKDTGAGIPKEKLEKIFEDFFQVDETREQSKERGTGLGLAICARIVREHGGRIWAESRLGEGTRFYFTLPAAREEA